MSGVLNDLQTAALTIMQGDKYYARVALLTEQLGDIRNQIQISLGKLGICAIIMTPSAECKLTNCPGPILDPLKLSVDIVELVVTNRGANGSKQPASEVAEHTAWLLHYPNHAHHRKDPCIFTARSIRQVPDKLFLVYRVEFTTSGSLSGLTQET